MTFAFRISSGKTGLLQLMRFRDNPGSLKLRYKFAERPTDTAPALEK